MSRCRWVFIPPLQHSDIEHYFLECICDVNQSQPVHRCYFKQEPYPLKHCDITSYRPGHIRLNKALKYTLTFASNETVFHFKSFNYIHRCMIKQNSGSVLESSTVRYEAYSESKYHFAVKKKSRFHIKFNCYQILHSSNYFSTYSPPLLRHLS